jgi:hypothetical protein
MGCGGEEQLVSSLVDVDAQLRGLKDFQRATAHHVFKRLYLDDDPAHRYLVADEVGLGKTLVARGVIAQSVAHLERLGTERIDVVYICSNAAIARQNLRRLNPTSGVIVDVVDRLTMLPIGASGLEQQRFNMVAITPGTSLDFGRRTGAWKERALLHWLLTDLYGRPANRVGVMRAFTYGINEDGAAARFRAFKRQHRRNLDSGVVERLWELIALRDEDAAATGEPTIAEALDELGDRFRARREGPGRAGHRLRLETIGELRTLLAEAAVELLEPDLVILDEFQRFKQLLDPGRDDHAAKLARNLFAFTDPGTNEHARVLMLSATPYKMYTLGSEVTGDDHYRDLLATADFLFGDADQTAHLEAELRQLRQALTVVGNDGGAAADAACRAVEQSLGRVMVRTERLASTPDRAGMLSDRARWDLEVTASDVAAYAGTAEIAKRLGEGDVVEYWKSAPYLVNFMEGYKLKRTLQDEVDTGDHDLAHLLTTADGLLRWSELQRYADIDPANGRLRTLLADTVEAGLWRLLWLPPAAPYYTTGSEFEDPAARTFTKRLIFSSWAVVPKAIASLVSYAAEREIHVAGDGSDVTNRVYDQKRESRGLDTALMSSFVPLYPSFVLVELVDPLEPGVGAGALPHIDLLRARLEQVLADRLSPLIEGRPTSGRIDERWYWAAAVYLDWEAGDDNTHAFAADRSAAEHWMGRESDGQFAQQVDQLQDWLGAEDDDLGRVPADLVQVLVEQALGSPAVVALRSLGRQGLDVRETRTRAAAARIAWGFRSLFNLPESNEIIGSRRPGKPYWRACLAYGVDGNLQAVIDEYLHVLREWRGIRSEALLDPADDALDDLTETAVRAISMRTADYRVDVPEVLDGKLVIDRRSMRGRFAVPFGDLKGADDAQLMRSAQVSESFNSPFWPFVVASTSVGQEGLDFHLYSHAIIHWNLPANPVDLEQREGRVHRFKGHAVRKNVAADHHGHVPVDGDPWDAMFARAAEQRGSGQTEVTPYWVYPGDAQIERHVPMLPFSREVGRYGRLKRSVAAYRMAFGAPRQEELVAYLTSSHDEQELALLGQRLRVDLSPTSDQAMEPEAELSPGSAQE